MATKEECIIDIYDDILKLSDEKTANIVYQTIKLDILIKFLFVQIKNKNLSFLQLLWFVFKKYDYTRYIINDAMIDLIIASFNDTITFFEIFKWYEEFGINDKMVSSNTTTALYIKAKKYTKLTEYLINIINRINNKDIVYDRTIFFIYDEVNIIKKYFTNNKDITYVMNIRCYQYDAINTLKQLHYKSKNKFFDTPWYLLSPEVFNNHMINSNKDPYENETFAIDWINYVCNSYHWDYLPTMILKMTYPMWQRLIMNFYMGYLTPTFVQVLIHQMKKHHIPFEKLASTKYKLVDSDYISYLKENYIYDIFANNNKYVLIEKNTQLSNIGLETTVSSVPSMLVIFKQKRIDALTEIIFDSTLNMSNKYVNELNYIDHLLINDELGWDDTTIKTYQNFKIIMQRILEDSELSQNLVNDYNSFLPLAIYGVPICYQLRYFNSFIETYNKLKIKKFRDEFKMIYDNSMQSKLECLKYTRKETNNKLDSNIIYTLPENPTIFDQFRNLIENSSCYDYSHDNSNSFWINELSDNKYIRNIVKNMLDKYYVPIQKITPILYNYYSHYATEEHFFLE